MSDTFFLIPNYLSLRTNEQQSDDGITKNLNRIKSHGQRQAVKVQQIFFFHSPVSESTVEGQTFLTFYFFIFLSKQTYFSFDSRAETEVYLRYGQHPELYPNRRGEIVQG